MSEFNQEQAEAMHRALMRVRETLNSVTPEDHRDRKASYKIGQCLGTISCLEFHGLPEFRRS